MTTRQAEMMKPNEYLAAIEQMPVAFIPWGALEWHGPHCPLGVDSLKPHALSLKIADELGGGVVFPPVYAGHRTLRVRGFKGCLECKPATVMALMHDTLSFLDHEGFRQVIIVPGHYGLTHKSVLTLGIETWVKERGEGAPQVWQASDYEIGRQHPDFETWDNNDHAGMWETSIHWALNPETVDMDNLEERPEGSLREDQGILGRDPKRFSSIDLGERIVAHIIPEVVKEIRRRQG